jgi:chemotaxis protein methyltransferase CheR
MSVPAPEDVDRFGDAVRRSLGLDFAGAQRTHLADVFRLRLRETRLSPAAYLESLGEPLRGREELRFLAQELTVTETSFFRDPDQIDAFLNVAIPERIRARSGCRRLRILSAGCASGEEAYTLAACLSDQPGLVDWDISIHGIDINRRALRKAAAARFSSWSLRQTPAPVHARLFRRLADGFLLAHDIRERVTFEERNLVADDPDFWQPAAFDIIFCRNVLMYFAPDVARSVVARLTRSLVPGGFLFLGHAETLRGLSTEFETCQSHGSFFYRRADAEPRARPQPAARPSTIRAPAGPARSVAIPKASARAAQPTGRRSANGNQGARPGPAEPRAAICSAAMNLLSQERHGEAERLLDALPPALARDPGLMLLKAVAAIHGSDLAAAERICQALIGLDPGSAGAHYLIALCREHADDRATAIKLNRIAARLDPGFAMPRLRLGLLSCRNGDRRAARGELRQALMLLEREDSDRIHLFGGGFGREALMALCRAQIAACSEAA